MHFSGKRVNQDLGHNFRIADTVQNGAEDLLASKLASVARSKVIPVAEVKTHTSAP